MGTDIHMIAEVRKNGKWETILDNIFNGWTDEKTCVPYQFRNYNLFAILANVRNGVGFGGCITGETLNYISLPKGYPDDMDERSEEFLSYEHSGSWLTLKEIFDFNWLQEHRRAGYVSEDAYKNCIMKNLYPTDWCGDIYGKDIEKVSPKEMEDIILGQKSRDLNKRYYTFCYFNPMKYLEYAEDFLESMNILNSYVPENGSLDDVRIIFDFDS